MSLRLNIKFAICLLVLCVACGFGTHFLHGYQVQRNAGVFLERANRAKQEAETADEEDKKALQRKEMEFLRRYLTFRPRDTEARARLGRLMDERARLTRSGNDLTSALLTYETVLRHDPTRKDIRLKAVEAALLLGRPDDALKHLDTVGAKDSSDSELHALYARALAFKGGTEDLQHAREQYAKAITLPPVQLNVYPEYAIFLRTRVSDPAAADKVMEQMVKDVPNAKAFLLQRSYWKRYDTSKRGAERAARALAEAEKLEPANADVLLEQAEAVRAEGGPDALTKARKFLERGIEVHPKDVRTYLTLSMLEQQAGRMTAAVAAVQRGLQANAVWPPPQPGQVERSGKVDLLWALADLRVADANETEITDLLDQLKKGGIDSARLDYLRARMLLAKKNWRESANLLERIRTQLDPYPVLARHTDLLLARNYERLGDTDQARAAYQRLVSGDPLSIPGNLGLGAALETLGRDEEALKAYQRLVRMEEAGSQARLRLARLLIRRNQQKPASEQRWDEVDQLLKQASKSPADAVEAAVLQATAYMARDQAQQAEKVLLDARKQHPKEVILWTALAEIAEQRKQPKEADAALDEAEHTVGDSVDLRLTRASLALRRDRAKSAPVLTKMGQGVEKFPASEQERLLRGLAAAYNLAGDQDGASRLWRRVAELRPHDLGVRIALFDLALATKKQQEISRAIDDIRAIEGEEGSLWKFARATQVVEDARTGDKAKLVEARELFEEVMLKRPSWPRAAVGLALAEELAGNPDEAIKQYQHAVELGDHSVPTIRALVLLLYQRRRFADAEAMLHLLPRQAALPTDLQRVAAEVSLRTVKDSEQAIALAQKAVSSDSKDYRDHLWLGQMLSQAPAHVKEAEKEFRRALALAENEPVAWVALVQFLTRIGKKDEALSLVSQAQSKLPRDESTLALAVCHETVGQIDRAKELYRDALAAHPDDPNLLINVAKFYLRVGDATEAENCLTRVMESKAAPDDVAWARRTLAYVLYTTGDYPKKRRALAMLNLDEPLTDSALKELSAEEIRGRASLLARSWERRQRQEAIRLLEALSTRQSLTAAEQFALGELYESIDKWSEATRKMGAAVAAEYDNLGYLAKYINSLLRHKEWVTTGQWLSRLEQKQPLAYTTVQLKARLLAGEGKSAEAAAAVMTYARSKDGDLRQAALLLEAIDRPKEAGDLYRQLAQDGKHPEAVLDLAAYLGRQGRTREALDECERASGKCKITSVTDTMLQVLYNSPDAVSHSDRVERWLTQAAASKEGSQLDFTAHFAALRSLQGRYSESAALYRKILARQPNNALVLNNLAFLTAKYENKPADALALLKQAWEQFGPSVVLSDTRALVYLEQREAKRAIEELEELVSNSPRAEAYFHLALAHEKAGDLDAARRAFLKTQDLKMKPTSLHPMERGDYLRMVQEFQR